MNQLSQEFKSPRVLVSRNVNFHTFWKPQMSIFRKKWRFHSIS